MSHAWMNVTITGDAGYARMHTSTNDDRDLGYPSGDARWTDEFRSTEQQPDALARALALAGTSRTGISGIVVTVHVNGQQV